jgi:hypothetical protein
MTTAMTENRKRDARSEAETAQTCGPPAIRSAHTPRQLKKEQVFGTMKSRARNFKT